MNDDTNIPGGGQTIPPHAISVYGQRTDALEDFPVLKAFQQYIDTEQAKAHKRLMSVCVFFTILILAVIGVFMFIIANLRSGDGFKGQSADAAIRALSDSNTALQSQVLEQARKMNEQLMQQLAAREARPAADMELAKQNMELQTKLAAIEIEKRLRAEQAAAEAMRAPAVAEPPHAAGASAGLQKAEAAQRSREAQLKERAAKLAAEEKRLHELEVKMHRMRMYPEYFDENGNELSAPVKPTTPPVTPPIYATPRAKPVVTPVAPVATPVAPRRPDGLDDLDDLEDLENLDAPAKADDMSDLDDILSAIDSDAPLAPAKAKPAREPAAKPGAARPSSVTERPDATATKISVGDTGSWAIPLE